MKHLQYLFILFLLTTLICACTPMKQEYASISLKTIDILKYQGVWYEIARFPSSFEKGLNNVTAEYKRRDDGKLTVINRGYKEDTKKLSKIQGKAWIPNPQIQGALKVQFFWPFSSWYLIAAIEPNNYNWVLITTPNQKYNWILARTPSLDPETLAKILNKATAIGIDTTQFEYILHDRTNGQKTN